jgi:hypothetical protein
LIFKSTATFHGLIVQKPPVANVSVDESQETVLEFRDKSLHIHLGKLQSAMCDDGLVSLSTSLELLI